MIDLAAIRRGLASLVGLTADDARRALAGLRESCEGDDLQRAEAESTVWVVPPQRGGVVIMLDAASEETRQHWRKLGILPLFAEGL